MLFHSFGYLFLFLPICVVGYFLLTRRRLMLGAKIWLALASLFFYGYWNLRFLPLLLASILFNYAMGLALMRQAPEEAGVRLKLFRLALAANLLLLAYFKYMDFFIGNANAVLGTQWPLLQMVLPLGISFFTLTQITFLVDAYEGIVQEKKFLNYLLFVTFFPHLLMGPVLHHREMIPQFESLRAKCWQIANVRQGLILLVLGLAKKILLADVFSVWVRHAYDASTSLTLLETLCAGLAYTFQLYFDFSGYTDMALGAALLFNVRLPVNFDSPFRAVNVIEFWQRWHISFTRFITTYLYTPLLLAIGRFDLAAMAMATVLTMGIAGLWHEAGWTFLLFYLLHALALIVNHWWRRRKLVCADWLGWLLTFIFLVFTIAIIRIKTTEMAIKLYRGVIGSTGIAMPVGSPFAGLDWWLYVTAGFFFALYGPASQQLARQLPCSPASALCLALLLVAALLGLNHMSEFLYFNF